MTVDSSRAILILSSAGIFISAELLYTYFPTIGMSTAYYWSNALMIIGICFVLWKLTYMKKMKLAAWILLMLSINNFIDEIFFNPTQVNVNEYIAFIAILMIGFARWKKIKKSEGANY